MTPTAPPTAEVLARIADTLEAAAAMFRQLAVARPSPTEPTTTAWLSVVEAAKRAGVCSTVIRRAIKVGELRSVRVSGRRAIRMKAAWIDAWLECTESQRC